jgi:hypothetical protein
LTNFAITDVHFTLSRNHFWQRTIEILEKVLASVGQRERVASLGMGLHAAQFLQPQTVIIFLRKSRFLGQRLTFTLAGYTHIISRICKLGKHTIGAEGGGWSTVHWENWLGQRKFFMNH